MRCFAQKASADAAFPRAPTAPRVRVTASRKQKWSQRPENSSVRTQWKYSSGRRDTETIMDDPEAGGKSRGPK